MRSTARYSCLARSLPRPRGPCRAAFSMVELVIVVLVMGILTAVVMPTFLESLLFSRVESATRRVKTDLELVRHTARLTSTTQTLTFIGTTYAASAAIADLDRPGQAYAVDLAAAPFELDTVIANFTESVDPQSISFDGYGTPTSSGTVILKTKNHTRSVEVDGITGQVSISPPSP